MTLTQTPLFMLAHGEQFKLGRNTFEFQNLEEGEALITNTDAEEDCVVVFRVPSGTLVEKIER